MGREKVGRNEPCPCGSGQKYKKCCYARGFNWVRNEKGEVGREVPLGDDLPELLEEARKQFVERHGREPGPDDKLFDEEEVQGLTRRMADQMRQLGFDPAYIYAYERTGLLLSEANMNLVPKADLQHFKALQDEYRRSQN